MTGEQIRQYLEFYRDLGIEQIYMPRIQKQSIAQQTPIAPPDLGSFGRTSHHYRLTTTHSMHSSAISAIASDAGYPKGG